MPSQRISVDHEPSPQIAALIMRESSAYLLDLLPLVCGDLDFLDGLLMLAIVQANVWPVILDPAAQAAFAGAAEPPPDERRRPVSIAALAGSLRLPYETVRRRVRRLVAEGRCRTTPEGVYVPTENLSTPQNEANLRAALRLTRDLHARLVAEGCFPAAGTASDWPEPPVRLVARVVGDYFLRMVLVLAERYGDPLDGFILMQIVRINARGHASGRAGSDPILQDSLRRPATVSLVARALGLSHELARRRVNALIARGACRRVEGGLIVPRDRLESPELRQLMRDNHAALRRMFEALGRFGALA
jgi:DNA-binding IclR family transcriptional regulator